MPRYLRVSATWISLHYCNTHAHGYRLTFLRCVANANYAYFCVRQYSVKDEISIAYERENNNILFVGWKSHTRILCKSLCEKNYGLHKHARRALVFLGNIFTRFSELG